MEKAVILTAILSGCVQRYQVYDVAIVSRQAYASDSAQCKADMCYHFKAKISIFCVDITTVPWSYLLEFVAL